MVFLVDIALWKSSYFVSNFVFIHSHRSRLERLKQGGAAAIMAAVKNLMKKDDVSAKELSGAATDGCSVMTGHRSGFVARLKDIAPQAISTHCANHRVPLAGKDVVEAVPYLSKNFFQLLEHLGLHLKNSPKRTQLFTEEQEVTALGKTVRSILSAFTRWLSQETLPRN
eukprot:g54739.t1